LEVDGRIILLLGIIYGGFIVKPPLKLEYIGEIFGEYFEFFGVKSFFQNY
jgi:hypothetical protein